MISLSSVSSEEQSSSVSLSTWVSKLQEGKKSTQQLQTDLLTSSVEQIEKMQEDALKKAEEKRNEENQSEQKNEEAVNVSVSSVDVSSSSDVPETDVTSSVSVEA